MVKFIESELVLLKKEIDEMWTLVSSCESFRYHRYLLRIARGGLRLSSPVTIDSPLYARSKSFRNRIR